MSQANDAEHSSGRWPRRSSIAVAALSITLSLFALAIVLGNMAAGAPPQADENAWAHLFQLSMAAQALLIPIFLVTSNWKRTGLTILLLGAQLLAAAAALGALWWSGY
jgi:hypothetical protein